MSNINKGSNNSSRGRAGPGKGKGRGRPKKGKSSPDGVFCTQYVNRWGKLMVAADYGYKAWFFARRK